MILYNDETLTRVNDNIELIQKKDGLTFGTDAYLLSAYMREGRSSTAVDFGCGTGIISLLCAARGKFGKIYAVDVQAEFCDVARRNCEHNGFENIEVIHSDVRELKLESDVVFTNPPYMKVTSGRANESSAKNIARHEVCGDINDFMASACRVLRFGGLFYAVYRTDRLIDLLDAMRKNGIEPKRMTYVHATAGHQPSMVLVEGKRGGKAGLNITKPLFMDGADIDYIYEKGEFPSEFSIK